MDSVASSDAGASAGASAGSGAAARGDSSADATPPASSSTARVLYKIEGVRCYCTMGVGKGRKLVAQGTLCVMQMAPSEPAAVRRSRGAGSAGSAGAGSGAGAGNGAGAGAGAGAAGTSDGGSETNAPLTFLMLGPFSYPLVGQSLLRTDDHHWVLPSQGEESWGLVASVDTEDAGSSAGDSDALAVRRATVSGLDALLRRYCHVFDTRGEQLVYDAAADPTAQSYVTAGAAVVASAIQTGSAWLAGSLVSGAQWAGSGLAW